MDVHLIHLPVPDKVTPDSQKLLLYMHLCVPSVPIGATGLPSFYFEYFWIYLNISQLSVAEMVHKMAHPIK